MNNEDWPSVYDPKAVEERIYKFWEERGYFKPKTAKRKAQSINRKRLALGVKRYAIHLPPPNVTGSLHMGHALNAALSDVLIRYHRMRGEKTVWFPGTDHAGIATQNVVEKQLKKEGISRWDLGREKFIERVWEWKDKYGNIIVDQFKSLGASCDWSRLRFTMDSAYADWAKKAFLYYYKKGLIYRGKRLISWCTACQTSLSDLEVEYKEEKGKLWYIKYPVAGGYAENQTHIVVATTRPETMLGDAAVAVNPKDKRYKNFIGKKILLPIQNREIPVVADKAVDISFGTGAVKVTPAHNQLDNEIGQRHKLPLYEIIDERGRMMEAAGAEFKGLKVIEAREKVVQRLSELGLLEKTEDFTHNVAVCYRSGTVLEPLLSNQWFLKMSELSKKTLKTVKSGKTQIIPKNFERIIFSWLENIRDWCISRQIWWGHRLPVWFHEPKCVPKAGHGAKDFDKCEEMVVSLAEPRCQYCDAKFVQSEDVLDTWFSSALWPFAGLSEADLKEFYPSNVLITARDIINLWVARMIFSGLEFRKEAPFSEVLIHATVLTKEGRRMSKSLGTGVDPLELIKKYGADATRFGIIWQSMGTQDIHWDEAAVMAGKKFANKLWNVSRFVTLQIVNPKSKIQNPKLQISVKGESVSGGKNQTTEDKEILDKLSKLKFEVEKDIKNYDFGPALRSIYDFVWHELADKYIESIKARTDEAAQQTIWSVLIASLKLIHPFMPFITEEIYQKLVRDGWLPSGEKDALIISEWES